MGQGVFSRLKPSTWSPALVPSKQTASLPAHNYDYLIKLMLIGDSDLNCTPTIGIDFKLRTIELDSKRIKMQLLDTAGQERFKTITTAHYRNAMGILLVYDITNQQSFKNIEEWLKNIDKHTMNPVNKILIGNKADLKSQRKVSTEEGRKLAERLNMAFFETSALDRAAVDTAFLTLTRDVKERLVQATAARPTPKGRASACRPVTVAS